MDLIIRGHKVVTIGAGGILGTSLSSVRAYVTHMAMPTVVHGPSVAPFKLQCTQSAREII